MWIKRLAEKYHEQAAANGTKIVHCCGYDSIPADLGTLLVVKYIRDKLGKYEPMALADD